MSESAAPYGPYILAAHVARRLGCGTIIDLDGRSDPQVDVLARAFSIVGLRTRQSGAVTVPANAGGRYSRRFDSIASIPGEVLNDAVAVSAGGLWAAEPGALSPPEGPTATVFALSSGEEGELAAGQVPRTSLWGRYSLEPSAPAIGVSDRWGPPAPAEAVPNDFQVVAVVPTYNEADIIGQVIEHLVGQQVLVYLIDNWSTDATYEIASRYLGKGLIHIERFPAGAPSIYYNWQEILHRIENVSHRLGASWVMHHDADEIRRSPWPDVSLRAALFHVDRCGFTAVDHTLINHPPASSNLAMPSLAEDFTTFERRSHASYSLQVKAWKQQAHPIDLAGGGHDAHFPGRRVYPFNFLIQHYPFRSQEHGALKLTQRRLRWRPTERAEGWHDHYDELPAEPDLLGGRSSREEFELETFYRDYFVDRATGTMSDEDPAAALERVVLLAASDQGRRTQAAGSSPLE